ncbi:hypothetical protein [Acanthopleuribacter pedis]|uniref:Uncharacterized protein n=1 Tax=Acanthopleuribacter pedis TaxID=442870 RepID=A0A8J7U348_9BACT|nr:hypothetical protein [Acanthopleuribacter pedis]MBO1316896.1 hypothetical protein [Acanthopleuribacter pedis]
MSSHFLTMCLLAYCLDSGIDHTETIPTPPHQPSFTQPAGDQERPPVHETFENDPRFLSWAYYLWREAGRGIHQTELSAWIGLENDHFFFHRWPHGHKTRQESWQGRVPNHVWANIHTHPNNTLARPSGSNGQGEGGDVAFAHKTGLIVYTVHRDGIYRYHPKTKKVTKVWNGPGKGGKAWWRLAEASLVQHFERSTPYYTKQYEEMQAIGRRWQKLSELRKKTKNRKPSKSWTRKDKHRELKAIRQDILRIRREYLTVIQGIDLDRRMTMALTTEIGTVIHAGQPSLDNKEQIAGLLQQ